MAPSRIDGAEPAERHTHYDAAGNMTGSTVVQRDPEWDPEAFDEAAAWLAYEASLCDGCSNELATSTRDDLPWDVDNSQVCHACAAKATVMRDDLSKHEKDQPKPGRPLWTDGRVYSVRPIFDRPEGVDAGG